MQTTLTSREREQMGKTLYELRGPAVALARRLLGDESAAEDACADAYVSALSRIDELSSVHEHIDAARDEVSVHPWDVEAIGRRLVEALPDHLIKHGVKAEIP